MKNIYFVIGDFGSGGAERTISKLSLSLSEQFKNKLVLYGPHSNSFYPFNGEVFHIDNIKRDETVNTLRKLPRRIWNLRKLKVQSPEATFVSLLEYPNLLNLLSGSRNRTIVSVRSFMSLKYQEGGLKAHFWNFTIKYLYPRASLIVAASQEIKQDLVTNYHISADKIKVIYNYYNLKEISELSNECVEPSYATFFDQPALITMGRLIVKKGQWHLLRVFRELQKTMPELKLVILGEGKIADRLKTLSLELGIASDTLFLGSMANPFKYLARAKIFVQTSLIEGFPNALAEAMACGLPVISTDCHSGPREILAPSEIGHQSVLYGIQPNRFGVLYPVDDTTRFNALDDLSESEQILHDAIRTLLTDNLKYKSYKNLSTMRIADFDVARIIHEWESIL